MNATQFENWLYRTPGFSFEWDWTDWLGLGLLLLVLGFLAVVVYALRRGESPLRILGVMVKALTGISAEKKD